MRSLYNVSRLGIEHGWHPPTIIAVDHYINFERYTVVSMDCILFYSL